jgi:hypothetical protein
MAPGAITSIFRRIALASSAGLGGDGAGTGASDASFDAKPSTFAMFFSFPSSSVLQKRIKYIYYYYIIQSKRTWQTSNE